MNTVMALSASQKHPLYGHFEYILMDEVGIGLKARMSGSAVAVG